VGPLYDAVGLGMWTYSNASFRVVPIGPRRFHLEPSTLIVVTHRRETDVPVIAPLLYFGARFWRDREHRMAFAARDDMFFPGFFAGFPEELPRRARRALFHLDVGRFLPRVEVHPISSASLARAGELVRALPEAPLAELLPAELADAFRVRSDELGLSPALRGTDVLRGEYADLLWRPAERGDGVGPDGFWERRAARAAADFRRLVEVARERPLVVFPEGRPSPDGEIGPLRRGLSALVRRVRPQAFLLIALAYDPLVRGRTRVVASVRPGVEPPKDAETATLELLKQAMPLTAGQYVAHELLAGRDPTAPGLTEAVEGARGDGRPVDPELLDPSGRRGRLADARQAAERRQRALPFLAREYASARSR
jgi:hypothetical protein